MSCVVNDPYYEACRDADKINNLTAMLCAVLSGVSKMIHLYPHQTDLNKRSQDNLEYVLNLVNWKETGVDKEQVLKWWEDHKSADQKRKEAEERQRRENEIKKKALRKLTKEERKVLGL